MIANICLLTSQDNKHISDDGPSEYFQKMPHAEREKIFASACIPLIASDGSKPYADFLNLRAEALATAAKNLIETGAIG